jgi:hypothetical protein
MPMLTCARPAAGGDDSFIVVSQLLSLDEERDLMGKLPRSAC